MPTDIRYVDYGRVKRFLEENGFRQTSVQPSMRAGQTSLASDNYSHSDGRSVTLGKKDKDGSPYISGMYLTDSADRSMSSAAQPFTSVEDLANFVNYGRMSNPADRGQKNLTSDTAIIRIGYRLSKLMNDPSQRYILSGHSQSNMAEQPPEAPASDPEYHTRAQSGIAGGQVRMETGMVPGTAGGGTTRMEMGGGMCPHTKMDEQPGTKHNPTDCHTRLGVSLGNRPVEEAKQKLGQAGYVMDRAQGELGSTMDYTYRHPEGHEITISSPDNQNVSGIKYQFKPPKPAGLQGMQSPKPGNIFAQNIPQLQPGQKPGLGYFSPAKQQNDLHPLAHMQPQQKPAANTGPNIGPRMSEEGGPGSGRRRTGLGRQTAHQLTTVPSFGRPGEPLPGTTVPGFEDMPAYSGGSFQVTGQGHKGFALGPFEQISGPGLFCDKCHTAMSTSNYSRWKGARVCRKCYNRLQVARVSK
jgi:hypothetical protein